MTRRLFAFFLAFAALFVSTNALAVTFPEHTGLVTDAAHLLVPAEKDALEHELRDLEQATTWEVAVVTVPTLEGETVERYAQDLFHEWGIGKKGENNGVLLLVGRQERKIRIQTGYHAESYLPDVVCKRIISNDIAKKTKQEDWSGGIADGTRHIAQIVRDAKEHPEKTAATAAAKDDGVPGWVIFLFIVVLVIVVIFVVAMNDSSGSYRSGGGGYYSSGDGGGSSWGGSSGSSGGGGGFDFGGGDSGGGGASGDG